MANINVEWNKKKNTRLVEGKPHVFHCHHYNCHLQRTIEDAKVIEGKSILTNAATEVAYDQFKAAFAKHPELKTPEQRLEFAAELFKTLGFGTIKLGKIKETGGEAVCPTSHYAKGWVAKWGVRKTPACFFNSGWIIGVVAAAYGKSRYFYQATETRCMAVKGKGACEYNIEVR